MRCSLSRAVRIVGYHDFIGILLYQTGLLGSQCRSERCNNVLKAALIYRDNVHIALGKYQLALGRFFCEVKREKVSALLKNGRIGRVEVLRTASVDYSSAERDNISSEVDYREHNSVAERIKNCAL